MTQPTTSMLVEEPVADALAELAEDRQHAGRDHVARRGQRRVADPAPVEARAAPRPRTRSRPGRHPRSAPRRSTTSWVGAVQQRDPHLAAPRSSGSQSRANLSSSCLRAARRADLDLGQAEDPVDRRGGHLHGADPVQPRGQHLAAEQAALQLDLRGGDPERVVRNRIMPSATGMRDADAAASSRRRRCCRGRRCRPGTAGT